MKCYTPPLNRLALVIIAAALVFAPAAIVAQGTKTATLVTEQSVRKHMEALASDDMRGRGSATADELTAAKYIASQLKGLKVEPAGDNGDYLQAVKFTRRSAGAPADAPAVELTTTNVLAIMRGSDPKLSKETVLLSRTWIISASAQTCRATTSSTEQMMMLPGDGGVRTGPGAGRRPQTQSARSSLLCLAAKKLADMARDIFRSIPPFRSKRLWQI
jgi:hypothetical protein